MKQNHPPLLRLVEVTKSFEAPEGGRTAPVLNRINVELAAGESVAITGPSGCGKSTLLNVIGTLERPTQGVVELEGQDLARLDDPAIAQVRARQIGFVFQLHHLLPQCTVWENVMVPTLAVESAHAGTDTAGRARQLLQRVGLAARMNYLPSQLSGGERQRVALVRSLINRPRLLLADEPTGALDRVSAENLVDLLVGLNEEEGVTLMVVTHAREVALRMKRRFQLRDGQLSEER